jgi:predicted ester cyclase
MKVGCAGMSRDPVLDTRRFWEEAFNDRDLSVLDDMFGDEYVNHAALPGTPSGAAGQAVVLERLWAAFPDGRFEIEHVAVDGDVVICIGTMSGTHDGELLGVPPSHRRVEWRMCHLMRFGADGRALEHRAIRDDLGLLRQMGAL